MSNWQIYLITCRNCAFHFQGRVPGDWSALSQKSGGNKPIRKQIVEFIKSVAEFAREKLSKEKGSKKDKPKKRGDHVRS